MHGTQGWMARQDQTSGKARMMSKSSNVLVTGLLVATALTLMPDVATATAVRSLTPSRWAQKANSQHSSSTK